MSYEKPKTVVICGGGIIGCATAYYLTSLEPDLYKCVIVECEEIANHSSGKAGGFLSLDWNDHSSAVGPLARLSFQLHEELSKILKVVMSSGTQNQTIEHSSPENLKRYRPKKLMTSNKSISRSFF